MACFIFKVHTPLGSGPTICRASLTLWVSDPLPIGWDKSRDGTLSSDWLEPGRSGKFSGPASTEKLKRKTKLNFLEIFHFKLKTFSTDHFYIHFSWRSESSKLKLGHIRPGCVVGRCEKWKFGEMYCPQMKLGACHKNKIVLEKEKISKMHRFLRSCI